MVKIVLTGATGTAGSEVLRQALLDSRIDTITVLSRRPLPPHVAPSPPSPKVNVVLHDDFASFPPSLISRLKGHDACIWALGTSSVGWKEADYEVVTKDYAVAAAKAFAPLGTTDRRFVFAFLSGHGADQRDGKAGAMFGRVKGRAERDLAALPISDSTFSSLAPYSFRPAGIVPVAPIPEASYLYRSPILSGLVRAVGFVAPSLVISTPELAKGLIEVALKGGSGSIGGWPGKGAVGNEGVFENEEIKRLAKGQAAV